MAEEDRRKLSDYKRRGQPPYAGGRQNAEMYEHVKMVQYSKTAPQAEAVFMNYCSPYLRRIRSRYSVGCMPAASRNDRVKLL